MGYSMLRAVLPALLATCLDAAAQAQTATATLAPTAGNTASGTVTFTQKGDKVMVSARVSGLTPGETVVTDGQLRLRPGSKIRVAESAGQDNP